MNIVRTARAGSAIEDFCRACKTDRMHTVIAADPAGRPLRVACGFCRSEHNYRGGPQNRAVERSRRPQRPCAPAPAPRARGAGAASPRGPATDFPS